MIFKKINKIIKDLETIRREKEKEEKNSINISVKENRGLVVGAISGKGHKITGRIVNHNTYPKPKKRRSKEQSNIVHSESSFSIFEEQSDYGNITPKSNVSIIPYNENPDPRSWYSTAKGIPQVGRSSRNNSKSPSENADKEERKGLLKSLKFLNLKR